MADLIEGTYATGAGVFRPGRDFTPTPSDDDSGKEEDTIDPFLQYSSTQSTIEVSDGSIF